MIQRQWKILLGGSQFSTHTGEEGIFYHMKGSAEFKFSWNLYKTSTIDKYVTMTISCLISL